MSEEAGARDARYLRQMVLAEMGPGGQRRLADAAVAVLGAGGLGSPVLSYLAGAGVGRLTIFDDDRVDVTNLHRQVIHDTDRIGEAKVDSARNAIARLNPAVDVVTHETRLIPVNAVGFLRGHDVIVDGSDNFATRYTIDDAAAELGVPVVWGSILRFDGQVSVFDAAEGVRYRDVFPSPSQHAPTCAEAGVIGPVCALIGSMMALEVVELLTGCGTSLLGRMLVLDGLRSRWREIPLSRTTDRAVATPASGRLRQEQGLAAPPEATEILTRLLGNDPPVVVDLRESHEARDHPLPRSIPMQVTQILNGSHGLVPDQEYLMVCEIGRRSLLAVRILSEDGFTAVAHLPGGVNALHELLHDGPWPWTHAAHH